MAIRSIKTKLVVGEDDRAIELRRALWNTHRLFNKGVSYYMRWLLLLRQEPVAGAWSANPAEDLWKAVCKARESRNLHEQPDREKTLKALRQLYEKIVPSSVGETGDAKSLARQYLSPLVDPESKGSMGVCSSGRKPRWMKLKAAGDPAWEEEKQRYESKRSEKTDREIVILLKKDLGVLPLFQSFSDHLCIWKKRNRCTTWDRDMFQQALERLLSWESWNRRVAENYQNLSRKFEKARQKHLEPKPEWAKALEKYQEERKHDLDSFALASDAPYRILPRSIRAWRRLGEAWLKERDKSEENLWRIAASLQTELRGGFGDPDLFRWLARKQNQWIWNEDPKRISIFAALNQAQVKLEEAKTSASFTSPDPALHPLWARHDGLGGNLHKYQIVQGDGDGNFLIRMDLLFLEGKEIVEKEAELKMARSDQFCRVQVCDFAKVPQHIRSSISVQEKDKKRQWVRWEDLGTRHVMWGRLGGSKIQFDRPTLEKLYKKKIDIDSGVTGPVFFNVSFDIVPAVAKGSRQEKVFKTYRPDETSPRMVLDFDSEQLGRLPLTEAKPGTAGLEKGLRAMSVDLGTRAFAACSIFEISDQRPRGKLAFPVKESSLWAVHQRSMVLALEGEKDNKETEKKREELRETRLALKAAVRKLSRLLSLADRAGKDRTERFEDLVNWSEGGEMLRPGKSGSPFDPKIIEQLRKYLGKNQKEWKKKVLEAHAKWEKALGEAFSKWRREGRVASDDKHGIGGISYWWLEELTEARKLINSWSLHARRPGEIVRARAIWSTPLDKSARMVDTDKRLLEHINKLKEDRTKKGADQLIMAALGYVYEDRERRWVAKYPPCRLILFEDLGRYKFRTDRPRRENAQLMKWSHRAITRTVAMQGDLFGIMVGSVGAGFTSRFHAASGAPGVRAHVVKASDLERRWFAGEYLRGLVRRGRLNEEEKASILGPPIKKEKLSRFLKPGQLVPWRGGELFVTLQKTQHGLKPIVIHADINAAQNLQRRFWTRYDEPTRLSCVSVKRGEVFLPRLGKRLEKSLGYGKLVRSGSKGEEYTWQELDKKEFEKLSKEPGSEGEEEQTELESTIDDLAYLSGETRIFFRDPSGIFFRSDRWYPSEIFWTVVHEKITGVLESPKNII